MKIEIHKMYGAAIRVECSDYYLSDGFLVVSDVGGVKGRDRIYSSVNISHATIVPEETK